MPPYRFCDCRQLKLKEPTSKDSDDNRQDTDKQERRIKGTPSSFCMGKKSVNRKPTRFAAICKAVRWWINSFMSSKTRSTIYSESMSARWALQSLWNRQYRIAIQFNCRMHWEDCTTRFQAVQDWHTRRKRRPNAVWKARHVDGWCSVEYLRTALAKHTSMGREQQASWQYYIGKACCI